MHCGQNVSWKLLEIISADLLDTVYTVTVPSTSDPGCDEILLTNYFCIGIWALLNSLNISTK